MIKRLMLVVALLCSGCSTALPIPDGAPTATILFFATPSEDRNVAQHNFRQLLEPRAREQGDDGHHFLVLIIQPDAIPTPFVDSQPKLSQERFFEAGKRLYIEAAADARPGASQWSGYSEHCRNGVSFVPEPNHRYSLTQISRGRNCTVEVLDRATNTPPPTLQFFNAMPPRP